MYLRLLAILSLGLVMTGCGTIVLNVPKKDYSGTLKSIGTNERFNLAYTKPANFDGVVVWDSAYFDNNQPKVSTQTAKLNVQTSIVSDDTVLAGTRINAYTHTINDNIVSKSTFKVGFGGTMDKFGNKRDFQFIPMHDIQHEQGYQVGFTDQSGSIAMFFPTLLQDVAKDQPLFFYEALPAFNAVNEQQGVNVPCILTHKTTYLLHDGLFCEFDGPVRFGTKAGRIYGDAVLDEKTGVFLYLQMIVEGPDQVVRSGNFYSQRIIYQVSKTRN